MVHRIQITGGKEEGSIRCMKGRLSATEHETTERRALLGIVEKIHSVQAVHFFPVNPRCHQTYVVAYPSAYQPNPKWNEEIDAGRYLSGEPHCDLIEIVRAFMKDGMSEALGIVFEKGRSFYFTKNAVPCEVST